MSTFSEIFEEEKSVNRRAEIQNENIRTDPKFNAAQIFNSLLERHSKLRASNDSTGGVRNISEGAKGRSNSREIITFKSPYYYANLKLYEKSNNQSRNDSLSMNSEVSENTENANFQNFLSRRMYETTPSHLMEINDTTPAQMRRFLGCSPINSLNREQSPMSNNEKFLAPRPLMFQNQNQLMVQGEGMLGKMLIKNRQDLEEIQKISELSEEQKSSQPCSSSNKSRINSGSMQQHNKSSKESSSISSGLKKGSSSNSAGAKKESLVSQKFKDEIVEEIIEEVNEEIEIES